MEVSRFIRTVTYGGFDAADVIGRLDHLYERIYGLESRLRETDQLLESSDKGEDIKAAAETILAEEREKLTQVQVMNEELSVKLNAAEEKNKRYEAEIKKLKSSLEETSAKLTDANTKLAAAGSEDDTAALSAVFIEAKRSADMIETAAKEKADQLEIASAEAAERAIACANDEGAVIIHDAQRRAAEIIADAKNAAGEMETAYNNMRASIFEKMVSLGQQLSGFKDAIMKFEENGVGNLYECEELLDQTQKTLNEGGIPEFKEAEKFAPDYPERPKRTADLTSQDSKKRKDELDRLRKMAESLTSSKESSEAPKKAEEAPGESSDKEADNKNSKSGLADLLKQARSLKDK